MSKCSLKTCDRQANGSRGLCHGHYGRLNKKGSVLEDTPLAPKRKVVTVCVVDGCNTMSVSTKLTKLYCSKHYGRYSKGYDVTAATIFTPRTAIIEGDIAKIPLGVNAKDGYAIVDKEFAVLDKYKWRLSNDGYAKTDSLGKRGDSTRMHHLIIGKPPKSLVTDHINCDKVDNRKENLRFADYTLNALNIEKLFSHNKSGYRGVWWDRKNDCWRPGVRKAGKSYVGGKYATAEEALKERESMFNELFKDYKQEIDNAAIASRPQW